jgi:predicted negative regulator of RcsB-dependent stress response
MHALKGDDPVEFADLQYKRGSIYLAQSQTAKAIEAYETALRANPHHPDARRMLDLARQAESAAR